MLSEHLRMTIVALSNGLRLTVEQFESEDLRFYLYAEVMDWAMLYLADDESIVNLRDDFGEATTAEMREYMRGFFDGMIKPKEWLAEARVVSGHEIGHIPAIVNISPAIEVGGNSIISAVIQRQQMIETMHRIQEAF
jgi:hypothetical protein